MADSEIKPADAVNGSVQEGVQGATVPAGETSVKSNEAVATLPMTDEEAEKECKRQGKSSLQPKS